MAASIYYGYNYAVDLQEKVLADMALAQSINLDSKTKGGIISIRQRPSTLQKWFLTANERTATTTATKRMIDLDESTRSTHKES